MSDEPASTAQAVRLIFEYEGDAVRLVSQQSVDMAVPVAPPSTAAGGYFVETRDDAGARLARVAVQGAFVQSTEVFPEDHSSPITRVDTEARGAFTVVVPSHGAAAEVAVVRAGPMHAEPADERGRGLAPAGAEDVDLATFPLEQSR
jgi:hypothetical protein